MATRHSRALASNSRNLTVQLDQTINNERLLRKQLPSFDHLKAIANYNDEKHIPKNIAIPCGWGRLLIGNTFQDPKQLALSLTEESDGQRDIALYVSNPQVVLSYSPQNLFLDPSDTMRIWMDSYRTAKAPSPNLQIRRAYSADDTQAINALYQQRKMVSVESRQVEYYKNSRQVIFFVAEHRITKKIIGTVMAVNHHEAYADPSRGSSLWSLAVSPDDPVVGIGEALVRHVVEYCFARGCHYLDLSVIHSNGVAKELYKKVGFTPISTFAIKNKNAINEKLFMGDKSSTKLNPYSTIITNEAMRRGIDVTINNDTENLFTLSLGGRHIKCHESLTELTSAISMHLCQNKLLTHKVLKAAGFNTPEYSQFTTALHAQQFLAKHHSVVVKPANSEQGKGVSVSIKTQKALEKAIYSARLESPQIILEKFYPGQEIRVVVIGFQMVAAAIKKPAEIIGDDLHTIKQLVINQSRRRQAATNGESSISLDEQTYSCIKEQGFSWDTVLPLGKRLRVCKKANLHTGGSLQDISDKLPQKLKSVSEEAARVLDIPVVGLDIIVPDLTEENIDDYVIIEANERPGLENHAPQPTAEKLVDLLFPLSRQSIK